MKRIVLRHHGWNQRFSGRSTCKSPIGRTIWAKKGTLREETFVSRRNMSTVNRFDNKRRFSTPILDITRLQYGFAWPDDATRTVNVQLNNDRLGQFTYMYLRDQCTCPTCLHPQTLQRTVDTLAIPKDIEPSLVDQTNNGVIIHWNDGHQSEYSYPWLEEMKTLQDNIDSKVVTFPNKPKKTPWDGSFPIHQASISFQEINADEKGVKRWLDLIHRYGFALVTGVKEGNENSNELIEKTKILCQKISYIRNTFYGGYWDFSANMEIADMAYTNLRLEVHTDGCYFQDPPGIQVFHLLEFDGIGGQTMLVDGLKVVQKLKQIDPESFEFLLKTPIPFHYLDNERYMMQKRTVFELDETGDLLRFSFNNDDRAPAPFSVEKQHTYYNAIQTLLGLLRDPQNTIIHQLKPGNVMFIDNWRVLHGRESFTGHRRLSGCYLNREDFQSRHKKISEKLK